MEGLAMDFILFSFDYIYSSLTCSTVVCRFQDVGRITLLPAVTADHYFVKCVICF